MTAAITTSVRAVNGSGPRCGCGELSRLHVTRGPKGGLGDCFLCTDCAYSAVAAYLNETGQPNYGPEAEPPFDYPSPVSGRGEETRP